MHSFFSGAAYPFRALAMINRNRALWGYILVPLLLNLLVGATLYAALLLAGFQAIEGWVASLPEWAQVLGGLLRLLLIIALLLITGFVLVRFGVLLGSPFYSKLSEQLEAIQSGQPAPEAAFTLRGVLADLWRALGFELKKLLLVASIGLPTLLLNFIPVAGQILELVGWGALGATIACLDFFDAPLERRRLRFGQKLALVRRSLPASAGFGLVALGLVSIPLLNLLAIPLCVTAGTLFFCDRLRPLVHHSGQIQ